MYQEFWRRDCVFFSIMHQRYLDFNVVRMKKKQRGTESFRPKILSSLCPQRLSTPRDASSPLNPGVGPRTSPSVNLEARHFEENETTLETLEGDHEEDPVE